MLVEIRDFGEEATLVMRTGVQFLDFGLKLDLGRLPEGGFVRDGSQGRIARLDYDPVKDSYSRAGESGRAVKPSFTLPAGEAVKLFADQWVPVPYLHADRDGSLRSGPTTWARACIASLAPGDDPAGFTHRFTVAIDTNLFEGDERTGYLAPTMQDVQSGARFQFSHRADQMDWFPEEPWIDDWIREQFEELAGERLRLDQEEIGQEVAKLQHRAHYLNLLWVMSSGGVQHAGPERPKPFLPRLRLAPNTAGMPVVPVDVDLVVDIGNSRTCGILIEDHPQEPDGLRNSYRLELRDLSQPHRVYDEPFESRLEFLQASFGKQNIAARSGRHDAFVWPTLNRIGPEASRFAAQRRGTEGSTGLSSPKRYLWDEDSYAPGWRFNRAFSRDEVEPSATARPFGDLINDKGEALYTLPHEDQIPVFEPRYARSALMTMMLSEVLAQALCQINSVGQRLRMHHSTRPRRLRAIILTVPPSMPLPERQIFSDRARQAVALIWKALGWHPEDAGDEDMEAELAWPPFPTMTTSWDEATCAQVVYLFSEVQTRFGGRPEEFFRTLARWRPGQSEKPGRRLRIASVDIGGGTTDLVVTDYALDDGAGNNVYIQPTQLFRDGVRSAGDDLLLEVVQKLIVPELSRGLEPLLGRGTAPLLSRLIGAERVDVQARMLRQQFTLQVLLPLGLAILRAYEEFDPIAGAERTVSTFGERLAAAGAQAPSPDVLHYFNDAVRLARGGAANGGAFDIMDVPLAVDLDALHLRMVNGEFDVCKRLNALCEVANLYDPDVLLLTGRPSRLPGVQSFIRGLQPVPIDRIVALDRYRAGVWYPFHRQGLIDDPKTTAVVGAMLCVLSQGRIPGFYFNVTGFSVPSIARFIGRVDTNSYMSDEDVWFRDVRLDDEQYALPRTPIEMRGPSVIGYRQLDSPRWIASPLYALDYANDQARAKLFNSVISVTMELERGAKRRERFRPVQVEIKQGDARSVSRNDLSLKLNTMQGAAFRDNAYWLDTGSVVEG
jgi:hypothetical protein